MDKCSILIELPFFPSIEYMQLLKGSQKVCFEAHESFQKQSHRNRAYILGSNGLLALTIPISKLEKRKKIMEVKIDNSSSWQSLHLKTLESCYKSAPYYEYYIDDIITIYNDKDTFYLWEFNRRVWQFVKNTLSFPLKDTTTHEYTKSEYIDKAVVLDYRNALSRQMNYQDRTFFTSLPYTQIFGSVFTRNLSVLDLIFNKGPEGLSYL